MGDAIRVVIDNPTSDMINKAYAYKTGQHLMVIAGEFCVIQSMDFVDASPAGAPQLTLNVTIAELAE